MDDLKTIVKDVLIELRKEGVIEDNFVRTEKVLYNYPFFKKALAEKRLQLEDLNEYGAPNKSKSIVAFTGNSGGGGGDPLGIERLEALRDEINKRILEIESYLSRVEFALGQLDENENNIITWRYFEGKSYAVIAARLGVVESTITRAKNRIINKLKAYLFTSDTLKNLLF